MVDTGASPAGAPYDSFYAHRERNDIALDKLSETEWRVCDRRLDEHDAPSVLGVIERRDEGFEVLEIGHGPDRRRAATLEDAVALFIV